MKKVIITEQQYKNIILQINENEYDEGFGFGKNDSGGVTMKYLPNKNSKADTHVYDDNKNFKYNVTILPKSGVTSINLYDITAGSQVTRPLKHNQTDSKNPQPVEFDKSMDEFFNKTILYIYSIIKNKSIDYMVSPQSSSTFNKDILTRVKQKFCNTVGIQVVPELLQKDVKQIYVNVDIAREVGLNDAEIHKLQTRVEKWKKDENIRQVRKEIEQLQQEVSQMITGKRGRPSSEITNRVNLIQNKQNEIPLLRKGQKGVDPTVKNGKIKDWQIKSLDDKTRKAIENIFSIAPAYQNKIYKFKGKNILLWDDNISSGATLDDICLTLQRIGVNEITAMTLGVINPTKYGKDRWGG